MSTATLTMRARHEDTVIISRVRGYSVRRYYDPQTGQFISVDPAVDQTEAPYAYVNGNPVDAVDPLGLWGWNPIDDAESAWNAVNPVSTSNVFYAIASSGGIGASILGYNPFLPAAADFVGAANACSSGAEAADIFAGIGWTFFGAFDPEGDEAAVAAEEGAGIVARDGTEISGFTNHGLDRVIGDGAKRGGVKPQAFLDAIRNPTKVTEGIDRLGRPYKIYTGRDARVVVNPETGQVVSVNPLSGAGANR